MSVPETLYKCLGPDRTACNDGQGQWLPPGEWMPPIEGELVPCKNGYHYCRWGDLPPWLGAELWEIELRGEHEYGDHKGIAREARLVRRCAWWNERTARLFAADCAARALPQWEAVHPDDTRVRDCIETARRYARGEATVRELAEAETTARCAGVGVYYAATRAARAAAGAACFAAGVAATAAAGWAARAVASAAAATPGAVNVAAWLAAEAAERSWQLQRLAYYRDTCQEAPDERAE